MAASFPLSAFVQRDCTGLLTPQAKAAVRALEIGDGRLSHTYDEAAGLLRVRGRGIWTPNEVDDHFDCLGLMIGHLRTCMPIVKSLVDLREAGPQPHPTSDRMAAAISRIYRPEDRIAIIVASCLVKAQMRRVVTTAPFETFLSPSAAETWLRAYD